MKPPIKQKTCAKIWLAVATISITVSVVLLIASLIHNIVK
jgi:hypothetical protein